MVAKMRLHQPFIKPMARVVQIHRDLFKDDLFLGGEILHANCRPKQVRKMLDRPFREFREHIRVVGGQFLAW